MPIFFPHCRSTPNITFAVRNWLIDSKETAHPYEEIFVCLPRLYFGSFCGLKEEFVPRSSKVNLGTRLAIYIRAHKQTQNRDRGRYNLPAIALTQETKEWQYSSKGCAVSLPCDRRVKEATYLGLVRPLLEYASQAWDPCTDNLSNEIEKIQRRAARFVTSDYQPRSFKSLVTLPSS